MLFEPPPSRQKGLEKAGAPSPIHEVFQGIPRYLFRVYSPQSNGINKSEEIASGAVVNEIPSTDIFSLKGDVARRMVTSHLEWRRNKAGNLVSWTCSLLFALQHAIRREATDRGSFTSEDIRLCVVDTTLLPLGTFIPASILTIKLGISLFYTAEDHEIFSQGAVDIMDKSVTTSLASLSQSGLYLFLPKLMVKQALLKSRVRQLREQLFRKPLRATSEEVTQAREIASTCFGGDFEQPMLILLLALRKRPDRDSLIVNEIISDASDKAFPLGMDEEMPFPGASMVPEYRQYLEILSWKRHETREGSTESPAPQNHDPISRLYGLFDLEV